MMTTDWIKIDKRLAGGQKIARLAAIEKISRAEALGRMVTFWGWVDTHVKVGGRIHVDEPELARIFGWPETFFAALKLKPIAWLSQNKGGLIVPDFNKWFGQSAKIRIANTERQRSLREQKRNGCHENVARDKARQKRDQTKNETRRDEEVDVDEILRSTTSDVDVTKSGVGDHGNSQGPTEENHKPPTVAAPDWDQAAHHVTRACMILNLGSPNRLSAGDRSLLFKAYVLFGEGVFTDAIEGTRVVYSKPRGERPTKPPCAYLNGIFAEKSSKRGWNFKQRLAQVVIPGDVWSGPTQVGGVFSAIAAAKPP